MKTQNYFLVFALFALLNSPVVSATPNPGHDATSVGPGTFSGSSGDIWSFPGKVGIGTTGPIQQLHVAGNIALDGDKALVFGGDSTATPDTTPQAQLYLGGPDNSAYNLGATKVLIEGYDTEAAMTIMEFRDENDATDFLAKSANGGSALPTLYWRGKVGIGTSSPTYPLHVKGQIMGSYTDGSNTWRLERGSDVWLRLYESTGSTYQDLAVGPFWANGATRFDLAEVTPVREEDLLEPGDVVSIDTSSTVRMTRSNRSYDTLVAGIISDPKTASMVIGGDTSPEDIDTVPDKKPIALVGRVPCKATTENGPIAVGDLLVTSSKPGHAMKADTDKLKPGMVLGKALEPLNEGEGMIFVWVALQ
ncbi:MAG: hypothetical protein JW724_00175 [Candidatus Altiarchaeota archaeon]|nr:hypothetical protein [Candidatus Altiarchaeota archaeon]